MTKKAVTYLLALALLTALGAANAFASQGMSLEEWSELPPREALEVANQWRYERNDVDKSYVDTKEIVVVLKDGNEARVALPEDEMVIAVAPYISQTHR